MTQARTAPRKTVPHKPTPSRRRSNPGPSVQRRRRHGRPKLRVVRAPRRPRLPFFVVSLLVVGVLIAAVAGVQAVVSQSSFRMGDLSTRAQELQQRNGELRLQIAQLSSPRHLASQAKRLGMTEPDPSGVRVLTVTGTGGRSSRSAGVAAGSNP